jgi:hypothetical protein
MKPTHNKKYFVLSLAFLFVLVYIALFVNDQFVRPFLGDVLVVAWLYLFLKTFINIRYYILASAVLVFACVLEVAQFYNLVEILGLHHIKAARIIMGSTFDWLDIFAYTIGWVLTLLVEFFSLRLYRK